MQGCTVLIIIFFLLLLLLLALLRVAYLRIPHEQRADEAFIKFGSAFTPAVSGWCMQCVAWKHRN
jgi:hypothetical protein